MISFIGGFVALIVGYIFYAKFVEKVFGIDENRPTPAITKADGIDFVEMPTYKIFLIQLLNIAGLGPIFGAIAGALWGPAAFLWIVLGTIFAGGVHDYFSGMLSMKNGGESIPEVVGKYLGVGFKQFMRIFSVVVLVLVGVVFTKGPAGLLAAISPIPVQVWLYVIFAYFIIATIVPIDKVIGKIYPIFGIVLLIMAVGVAGGIILGGYNVPNIQFTNMDPSNRPIWPLLFITIACGAISGFHSTQSPIMARCVKSEKEGRFIFYGAMVAEGMIALIWAAAAMSFFGDTSGLADAMANNGGAAGIVKIVSTSLLGRVGGILAILGVIVCPITSGDTAFRSARLTIADMLHFEQKPVKNRYAISLPLFLIGFILTKINFDVIWRYFAWSNQTLAMIVLWASAMYLIKNNRNHLIASIPATFMTAVTTTYILVASEGFHLSTAISYPIGFICAASALALFMYFGKKAKGTGDSLQN
jgi:carbon starvation protein CstA